MKSKKKDQAPFAPSETVKSEVEEAADQEIPLSDLVEFTHGVLRTAKMQKSVLDCLSLVQQTNGYFFINKQQIPVTENTQKALDELRKLQAEDSDLPLFSNEELREWRQYDEKEEIQATLSLRSLSDFVSFEMMASLAFLIQRALHEKVEQVQNNATNFKSIFDHVQLMSIERLNDSTKDIVLTFY